MSRQVKRMKERKQLKQTKMKVLKFKVEEIKNVKETSNLMPPDWYNEKEGGYDYLWTNLTNLKLNEGVTDESKLKPVYYLGLGSKGKLGYKDGSYYGSCDTEEWNSDSSNPLMEWKFEVLEFHKEYDMAEYSESYQLMSIGATQSEIYYNGNNGFKEILESQIDDIIKLNSDIKEASNYFMSQPIESREGFYNGFEYRILTWKEVEELIPYQLPNRQEDEKVINSVASDVSLNHGDTSDIDPILVMNLKPNILVDDNGKSLEGQLNIAGNHRKKGAESGGASRLGGLFLPDFRTNDFGELEIQQLAAADNPIPKKLTNPTGTMEFVDIVGEMSRVKKLPLTHPDIDKYLESVGVKSLKDGKKIKALAKEQKQHAKNKTVPIKWSSKGWAAEAKRIVEALESNTSRAVVCSVEAFNIEMLMNVWLEANEKGLPITDFTFLMYGKNAYAWTMWDNEPKGRLNADKLIGASRNEVYDKKGKLISEINVHFRRLPGEHASVGIGHHNFWDSSVRGKNWLKDEGITLPKKEK